MIHGWTGVSRRATEKRKGSRGGCEVISIINNYKPRWLPTAVLHGARHSGRGVVGNADTRLPRGIVAWLVRLKREPGQRWKRGEKTRMECEPEEEEAKWPRSRARKRELGAGEKRISRHLPRMGRCARVRRDRRPRIASWSLTGPSGGLYGRETQRAIK